MSYIEKKIIAMYILLIYYISVLKLFQYAAISINSMTIFQKILSCACLLLFVIAGGSIFKTYMNNAYKQYTEYQELLKECKSANSQWDFTKNL